MLFETHSVNIDDAIMLQHTILTPTHTYDTYLRHLITIDVAFTKATWRSWVK